MQSDTTNLYIDTRTGELIPICSHHLNDPSSVNLEITGGLDKQTPRENESKSKCCVCLCEQHAYSVAVTLVGVTVATKICSATDAYHACSLAEEYMRRPSQYNTMMIERIRTQYKLADIFFDYEARRLDGGVHEDTTVNEFAYVVAGELVGWARDWGTASSHYHDELRVRNSHVARCPHDGIWQILHGDAAAAIPFDGIAPETVEWADDYGLQER